jgi:hypothetical protein
MLGRNRKCVSDLRKIVIRLQNDENLNFRITLCVDRCLDLAPSLTTRPDNILREAVGNRLLLDLLLRDQTRNLVPGVDYLALRERVRFLSLWFAVIIVTGRPFTDPRPTGADPTWKAAERTALAMVELRSYFVSVLSSAATSAGANPRRIVFSVTQRVSKKSSK